MLRFVVASVLVCSTTLCAQEKSVPVFKNGEAQSVKGFAKPSEWIRHELFVETEFNSDHDEKMDRVHVAVVRQKQTETEGLKVPGHLCNQSVLRRIWFDQAGTHVEPTS